MRRIALAIGTVALGLGTGGTILAQAPAAPLPDSQTPTAPLPDYRMYGGPSESRGVYHERRGSRSPSMSPLYKIPGVPDDIAAEDQAREVRRNAAVEFGMFRRQFTGSTEFWMDHDRTRLAKVRYSMDEPMWHSIHPPYDWGDGGYMYNTAASVGGPQWSGTGERVIVTPPETGPVVRHESIARTNNTPSNPVPSAPPVQPSRPTATSTGPLVASDRGDVPAVNR
jgi:hypothetical protein